MEDRYLLSDTYRLWGVPSSNNSFGYGRVPLDHIENENGQVVEKLPVLFFSGINQNHSSLPRTVYINKKESIIAFKLYLGGKIELFGIVNKEYKIIWALFQDYNYCTKLDFQFYDIIRQVIVFDTIVSYNGDILLENHGSRIIGSKSGFHLFRHQNENGEKRWRIFSPDLSSYDVEIPYSDYSVRRGFDHGVLLLGSTLINNNGKVILNDINDCHYHEDLSVFIVEDEETFQYNNNCIYGPKKYYKIILNKEGDLLFGVYGGSLDSYKLIDNYLLDKELGVWRTGIANPDFSILLPTCFEYVSSCDLNDPRWWIVKYNGRYGILSKDCKSWLKKPDYNVIKYDEVGVFKFSNSAGSGLMSQDGDVFFKIEDTFDDFTIDKIYLRTDEEYPEFIFVSIIDRDWNVKTGVVSQEKGEIVPLRHGWINSVVLHSSRFRFRVEGKIIDNGEFEDFNSSKKVISYEGGLVGLLDGTGEVILEPRYSSIKECFVDGFLPCYLAHLNQEWVLYDFNGQPLLNETCTYISWYDGGFARYIIGGSLDSDTVYEGSDVTEQTFVINGQFGLFNLATRRSTEHIYDYIGDVMFVDGKYSAEACLNGIWGTLNGRLEFTPSGKRREKPAKVVIYTKWLGEVDMDYGYSQEDLDDMYRGAYEGDSEAMWNTD